MSKWTDVRDNVVDALHVEDITEDVKQQSKSESGWCKIRDAIVLPLVIQGGVYIVKTVLSKTVKSTTAAATTVATA